MEAESMTRALGGRWYGSYGTACCPAHEDKRPSLSIKDGDNGLLLFCHAGCSFSDIVKAIKHNFRPDLHCRATTHNASKPNCRKRNRNLARSIWNNAQPIHGTPAEVYLRERSILGPLPGTLRFHPELRHPTGPRIPALIGRIDHGKEICTGIHRTFLDSDAPRKTSLSPTKAMLGRCAGGAVRLRSGRLGLVVCEGIETSLSLCDAIEYNFSVWSALSTAGVSKLQLPQPKTHNTLLIIAADGDNAGRKSATTLAERAARLGWTVEMVSPRDGLDFNDLARSRPNG